MPKPSTNLHLVSDSTGETLNSMARAVLARFDAPSVIQHRWFLVRTRMNLDRVIEGIQHEPGPVVHTLVDTSLRHILEQACDRFGVPRLSALDGLTELLQAEIGRAGQGAPGRPARDGRRLLPPHRRHALRAEP
jgi:regulator of PEP synthase PpsR (kinase-PPPase family)